MELAPRSTTCRSPWPRPWASRSRAGYYDKAGALRDMVQNHLLQLLLSGRDGAADARRPRDRPRREAQGAAGPASRSPPTSTARRCAASTPPALSTARRCRRYAEELGASRAPHRDLRRDERRGRRTGAGPACRSTCAPASAWTAGRPEIVMFFKAPPLDLPAQRRHHRAEPSASSGRSPTTACAWS